MKLNYNPYYKKKEEKEEEEKKKQLDFQLYNEFQNGLRKDLDQQKQDIQMAQGQILQGGGTVS